MKNWLWIAIVDALIVVGAIMLITLGSKYDLDRAYEATFGGTTILRNEWGQLRHNPEFMCEASIRQWLEDCGKE